MNDIKRIGFACKISAVDPKKGIVPVPEYNFQGTTISWLKRQTRDIAEEKLWNLMVYNLEAAKKAVEHVGNFERPLRLFRLGSDILPAYTEPNWSYFWQLPDVQAYAERHLGRVGEIARSRDVRLSFHPGQFCVLASENDDIVDQSIKEFEYHVDMARWMGFGKQFQDFKINVHISGRRGPEGIRQAYKRLSPEARNSLTIENEEITWNLNSCLELVDLVPIVLDIHHHWINTGEYIETSDPRIKKVIDSWRGVRPVIHYSVSREEYLADHASDRLPAINALMGNGHKKQKLRAHSDFYWNQAVNEWALTHNSWADIMCESKAKNLASIKLFESIKK